MIIQASFAPMEKVSDMRKVIAPYINLPNRWYLYITPPKTLIEHGAQKNKTIDELGLVPKGIVHIGEEDNGFSYPRGF